MHSRTTTVLTLALAVVTVSCERPASGTAATGTARVSLDGRSFDVRDVTLEIETGEEPWFRIDGEPVVDPAEDCAHGMVAGLGLYGDLPSTVHDAADIAGKRLRVDFTGDGDDANFCFEGMGGLAGAEEAWVTIDSVSGDRITFTMSGTFSIFDENGEGPVKQATASGTAVLSTGS
jgi:hypothetical protein